MDLYLLAELKTIALKITTVDMLKPPPDFRSNFDSTPPPILIDAGVAILENEKIERHIMKAIPGGHNLFVQVCLPIPIFTQDNNNVDCDKLLLYSL